jgi:hypothetical protein
VPDTIAPIEKLMPFLNTMRADYLKFLKGRITPDSARHAIRYTEEILKKKRGSHAFDNLNIGEDPYYRQYLLEQSATMERGVPFDCSGDGVVIVHRGITVLWLFPGCEMETFIRTYEPLKECEDYSWTNQCDEFPEFITEFWESLFDERKVSVPSNLGLRYDFWRPDSDAWNLAEKFAAAYSSGASN